MEKLIFCYLLPVRISRGLQYEVLTCHSHENFEFTGLLRFYGILKEKNVYIIQILSRETQ